MSEERTRPLSGIMFTDMVGYTALMQEDESRATTLRDRHRTVLREGIEAQQGEIVQFCGDGTLSVFPSAVQATESPSTVTSVTTASSIGRLVTRSRTTPWIP